MRAVVPVVLVTMVVTAAAVCHGRRPDWQPIGDGLEYRRLPVVGAQTVAHVVRADLRRCRLRVIDFRDSAQAQATVAAMAARTGALAMVNGGFFDTKGKPLGLVVSDGRETSRLLRRDWGVLVILNGRASIVHSRDFRQQTGILQALQVGPRLVVNGKPVQLKHQSARRTAVGIQADGRVVLLVTEGEVTLRQLAAMMAGPESQGGLGCESALHLDSGASTQMSIRTPRTRLEIPGVWPVVNGLGVFPSPPATRPGRSIGR